MYNIHWSRLRAFYLDFATGQSSMVTVVTLHIKSDERFI